MKDDAVPASGGYLARGLLWLGRVTSPETESGKRFTQAEKRLTELFARLAEHPRWLRVTGELLRQGSLLRIRRHGAIEAILRALRLPPVSEVDGLREQLRRMNDQIEALSSQLELIVELLEKQARDLHNDECAARDVPDPPPSATRVDAGKG